MLTLPDAQTRVHIGFPCFDGTTAADLPTAEGILGEKRDDGGVSPVETAVSGFPVGQNWAFANAATTTAKSGRRFSAETRAQRQKPNRSKEGTTHYDGVALPPPACSRCVGFGSPALELHVDYAGLGWTRHAACPPLASKPPVSASGQPISGRIVQYY